MRFKTSVRSISTFLKLTQSLSAIAKLAWLRLSEDEVRFVVKAAEGTAVWAVLSIQMLFEDYIVTSANNNIINLEVPLDRLHKSLRSCASASQAVLRLTKRASDGSPILALTVTVASASDFLAGSTLITQEIPCRVLSASTVELIQEPQAPESDVHIFLPPLSRVRGITERFNKLSTFSLSEDRYKLLLSANMAGEFKMALVGAEVKVESKWHDLQNPVLADSENREGHPSTVRSQTEFAQVRVDGREWAKVLKVQGLSRRVVACICDDQALVLYVFLTEEADPDQSVLTYYMSSYSA
ncbi:checkpoint protein Hus1/Mec3 [Pyronema omphalodes]|nr:checkpoint protein Hus1/Mec3 [Pyronema omphalodes]